MSISSIQDHFKRLAEYNYWANERLSNFILEIDEASIEKEINSSFPSIKETILHISDAEEIWLNRLKGKSLSEWPSQSFEGPKEVLIHQWLTPSLSWKKHVAELDEKNLFNTFTYQNTKGTEFTNQVADAITQVVHHSMYHRGQIVSMLHQLEQDNIPQTDFIKYLRE